METRILVLNRGWIVVGEVLSENDQQIHLINSSVIRRWGTTKGLGQLALEGKQTGTILDFQGDCLVHPLTVIQQIICKKPII